MFFTFDGLDGVGKSTQIELFCQWLAEHGHHVVTCRDPGSTALGEQVREILLAADSGVSIARTSEMFLYMAARSQLVAEVIRPALAEGKTVVSDRFLLANVVYQGHAGGLDVETLWQVGQTATGGLAPDMTFLLDMPPETAAERLGRELDRMEQQGDEFRRRLRTGFLAEANTDDRIVVIDAVQPIALVQTAVRAAAAALVEMG